jgi:hypothetical protein
MVLGQGTLPTVPPIPNTLFVLGASAVSGGILAFGLSILASTVMPKWKIDPLTGAFAGAIGGLVGAGVTLMST